MSGPKLISPLLDRFAIGEAISDHNGVRCYPAMRDDSDEKYIVKIVSIPASQVRVDALLLTGAYRDKASVLAYFKEQAEAVLEEAEVLQKLSKLEGFISYEGWQIEPMEDGVGFDVYLLGTYKHSLQRYMSRNPMTHLGAINLGLDLCSALAVCRRAGCLYVDLKPGNVYISDNQTYSIGDLGILPMDALRYASLPDRYRSSYTAPEIKDAFSSLNDTMDIYALGLILYQAYNNGELPFEVDAPEEVLPAPMYADYEMSEIILKACAPDPADRWQDPSQMGQALVGYMQRNGASDVPIIPPVAEPAEEPEAILPEDEFDQDFVDDQILTDVDTDLDEQITLAGFQVDAPVDQQETAVEEPEAEEASSEENPVVEEDEADLSFIDRMVSDETAPTEDTALDLEGAILTDELSVILAQADELISHEAPDPVVAPEPIEIPMPDPIVLTDESEEEAEDTPVEDEPAKPVTEESTEEEESDSDVLLEIPEHDPDTDEDLDNISSGKRGKGWIATIIVLLLLAALAFGAAYFYQNYYLQTISDISLEGSRDQLTVTLYTKIHDEKLTVVCTDTYGISTKYAVHDGVAAISGLNPATTYTITVEMEGFHQISGETSATYTTDAKTNVVSFTAITGPSDGSVILNFTPDGPEPETWTVTCKVDGEQDKVVSFAGHTTTVTELAVDKVYTFVLSADNVYLDGTDTITYLVTKVLYAQNLRFESLEENVLTLAWNNPEGYDSMTWNLTHYNGSGDVLSMATVTEKFIKLELDDLTQNNTFELLAEGMTQSNKITLSANPITVNSLIADDSDYPVMHLEWDFEGVAPANGWSVTVTADGSETLEVLTSNENSAQLNFVIPGAHYELNIQTVDGTNVFNAIHSFDAPEAGIFDDYWINTSNIEVSLCKTPSIQDWTYEDLTDEDYTNSFKTGEKASFVLHLNRSHADSLADTVITVVIRDSNNVPVTAYSETMSWYSMWNKRYYTMDISNMPQESGEYLAAIYFNGDVAGSCEFTIE